MNKVIMDAVFMRKHYGREIHELVLRENVTHLDLGRKVKEPGHKPHSTLLLVRI